ncbi:MAG: metallophosphoesterase [Anaerolineales bacterium]|nr:metallophosphoesterase [Anaerolineales bacterium]
MAATDPGAPTARPAPARALTLGVIADSHVPDRMRALPPALWDALAGVDAILHAGDICAPRVLAVLEQVAPVHAVRGNRDLFSPLPLDRVLTFGGVRVGLTHGHGGWRRYAPARLRAMLLGQTNRPPSAARTRRFLQQVRRRFTEVQVIVFGHTHRPVNQWLDGALLFNPGSLGPDYRVWPGPAIGRLTIAGGAVQAEIVPVPIAGAVLKLDPSA